MCLSSGTSLDGKHFETLKLVLLDALVLRLADVNQDFRVKTDESDFAVAGVLLQQADNQSWHDFRQKELSSTPAQT